MRDPVSDQPGDRPRPAAGRRAKPVSPAPPGRIEPAGRTALGADRRAGTDDYWRRQLAGAPPTLEFPTDFRRSTARVFRPVERFCTLGEATISAIRAISGSEGTEPSVVLLTLFKSLLSRLAGQEDIIVGLARPAGHALPLRTDHSGSPTLRELVARVRAAVAGARAHPAGPRLRAGAEDLPDAAGQVVFIPDDIGAPAGGRADAGFDAGAAFDLAIRFSAGSPGALQVQLTGNAAVFSEPRIQGMLDQFRGLLEQAVRRPDAPLAGLPLPPAAAPGVLPDPTTPLSAGWDGPVHRAVAEQARRTPNRIAVAAQRGTLTYAELDAASNRLANRLIADGIGRGARVAVYAVRSGDLAAALLGVLKAGAAFVILDPAYPPARLIAHLQTAAPRGWVRLPGAPPTPAEVEDGLDRLRLRTRLDLAPPGGGDPLAACSADDPGIDVGPDDAAYAAFTSGSTGVPKAILGTHRPLSHFLAWHTRTFGLCETDRFGMLSGLSHDPILRDIFTPLRLGATLCVPPSDPASDPAACAKWISDSRITVAHLTPPLCRLLTERAEPAAWPALRRAFFGGDILTLRDVAALARVAPGVRCANFYGTTETPQAMGVHVLSGDCTACGDGDRVPVGRGIDDVQLLVLNAADGLAGVGEVGEIVIRTPHLAVGYLGDDALTAAKFITNPFTGDPGDRIYRTGDFGRFRPDGAVDFVGRRGGHVKIRGHRIEPGDIEAVLRGHPAVAQAAVVIRDSAGGGQHLAAYVVPARAGTGLGGPLRDWLRTRLPAYMVPSAIVSLPALPLTPNGKLDRSALPDPAASGSVARPVTVPSDGLERRLLDIWRDCLGNPKAGLHDDFFDLGGHSLLAARLFARVESAFGRRLAPSVLFTAPTVAGLAFLLRGGAQRPAGSLVAVQVGRDRPPLFCFPGLPGHGLELRTLAAAMGRRQPFYAFSVDCPLDGPRAGINIARLAADLVTEMRTVQPTGPYHLAGYSFGGLLAYEAARLLAAGGETVASLALIDTWGPGFPAPVPAPASGRFGRHFGHMIRAGISGALSHIAERIVDRVRQAGRLGYRLLWACGVRSQAIKEAEALARLRQAMHNYVPGRYAGPVTLFRAARQPDWLGHSFDDPHHGWGRVVDGPVRVHVIPGDHREMIQEPGVQILAGRLGELLGA